VDDIAEQSDDDVALMTTTPTDPLVHWNFFARLFNIKPESKAIVLKLHRRDARHFVMRKLRDAKGHGLQDIKKDPLNHNYYTCRLGKGNRKLTTSSTLNIPMNC
jgi:hypothetical protein